MEVEQEVGSGEEAPLEVSALDYKNVGALVKFLSEGGRMVPSRVSGSPFKDQRKRRVALLRARFLGLLPYVRK